MDCLRTYSPLIIPFRNITQHSHFFSSHMILTRGLLPPCRFATFALSSSPPSSSPSSPTSPSFFTIANNYESSITTATMEHDPFSHVSISSLRKSIVVTSNVEAVTPKKDAQGSIAHRRRMQRGSMGRWDTY